jgi:fructokinase
MYSYDVVGVCNPIVDVFIRADDTFVESLGVGKGCMNILNAEKAEKLFLYIDDIKKTDIDITEKSGGAIANTIACMAAFGSKSAFVGKIGLDDKGKDFVDNVIGDNIYYKTTPSLITKETGRSLVIVTPDGKRTMCTYLGAAADLTIDDLDKEIIINSKSVLISSYLFDSASGKQIISQILDWIRGRDIKLCLALSDVSCIDRNRYELFDILHNRVDIVFASQSETNALFAVHNDQSAYEKLETLSFDNKMMSILTRSGSEVIVMDRKGQEDFKLQKSKNVVDATGLGSLFMGGFLFSHFQGYNNKKAVEIGHAAALTGINIMGARVDCDLRHVLNTSLSSILR